MWMKDASDPSVAHCATYAVFVENRRIPHASLLPSPSRVDDKVSPIWGMRSPFKNGLVIVRNFPQACDLSILHEVWI